MAIKWKSLFFSVLLLAVACGEVLEENITDQEVLLLAPADSAQLVGDSVTFWWEYVQGARDYEFHLVSPSFDNPQRVIADSITSLNRLTFGLAPGTYAWEVRALNAGYSTALFYQHFTIDTVARVPTTDIASAHVNVLAPVDGAETTDSVMSFWWDPLEGVETYDFRLVSPSLASPQRLLADTSIADNHISVQVAPGLYEWQVRAANAGSKTTWNTRAFSVTEETETDISRATITLLAPADDLETTSSELNLWWAELTGATGYQVVVVRPSFANIEELVLQEDTEDDTFQVSLDSGTYEWGVKAYNNTYETAFSIRSVWVQD